MLHQEQENELNETNYDDEKVTNLYFVQFALLDLPPHCALQLLHRVELHILILCFECSPNAGNISKSL